MDLLFGEWKNMQIEEQLQNGSSQLLIYAYLDTMASEEVSMIVRSDNVEKYYNKKLYSHQINNYYVALKELRFAYDYIEKNAKDFVIFDYEWNKAENQYLMEE